MMLQLWNETEEGLLSNEFGSIMHKFLQLQLLLPEGKPHLFCAVIEVLTRIVVQR